MGYKEVEKPLESLLLFDLKVTVHMEKRLIGVIVGPFDLGLELGDTVSRRIWLFGF